MMNNISTDLPEEYLTGITELDEQHRRIFEELSVLESEFSQPYPNVGMALTVVDQIREYTRAHFGFEEGLMDEVGCPTRETNVKQHADFSRKINDLHKSLQGSATPRETYQSYVDLVVFLGKWTREHICLVDCKIREYTSNLRPGYAERHSFRAVD